MSSHRSRPSLRTDAGAAPGPAGGSTDEARATGRTRGKAGRRVRYHRLVAGVPRPCTRRQWLESVRDDAPSRIVEQTGLIRRQRWVRVTTLFAGVGEALYHLVVIGGPRPGLVAEAATEHAARARHVAEVVWLQDQGFRVIPGRD